MFLSCFFNFAPAYAGELTVTGTCKQLTTIRTGDELTGNPLGMDRELNFLRFN